MKIFTCTGAVDLDEQVITADPNMCDNCKCMVINEMAERTKNLKPYRVKKEPQLDNTKDNLMNDFDFEFQMLVMT